MTDEELAAIREQLQKVRVYPSRTGEDRCTLDAPVSFAQDVLRLVAEVDRQQKLIIALRENRQELLRIAREVDRIGRDATGAIVTASPYITDCPLCRQRITGPVDHESRHPPLPKLGHRDDCPVMLARALLIGD